jgi:hypothetical protein
MGFMVSVCHSLKNLSRHISFWVSTFFMIAYIIVPKGLAAFGSIGILQNGGTQNMITATL